MAPTNQRLKIHCGLENRDGVTMHISNQSITWEPGKCYLLDDSFEHSITVATGVAARTILELIITHPDLGTSGEYFSQNLADPNRIDVHPTAARAGKERASGKNRRKESREQHDRRGEF